MNKKSSTQNYTGLIIEESLRNTEVLDVVTVTKTEVCHDDNPKTNHGFKTWHMHSVAFDASILEKVLALVKKHLRKGTWYADFKGRTKHYIVFRDKICTAELGNRDSYNEFIKYGQKVGLPEEQLKIF